MTPENDQPSAQTLLRALLVSGPSAQQIAEACGVTQPLVLAWAIGERQPDPVSQIVFEEEFSIPRPAWRSNQG